MEHLQYLRPNGKGVIASHSAWALCASGAPPSVGRSRAMRAPHWQAHWETPESDPGVSTCPFRQKPAGMSSL